jgi:hypothetical protein
MSDGDVLERDSRGGANRILLVVAMCFIASGAGGLVLEVTWTRMLRLAFGSTTLAISTSLWMVVPALVSGGLKYFGLTAQ